MKGYLTGTLTDSVAVDLGLTAAAESLVHRHDDNDVELESGRTLPQSSGVK